MSWIQADTKKVSAEHLDDLERSMNWFEKDGYTVDFNVVYMDAHNDMEVEVTINERFAGVARHYDDIPAVIDYYFENDEVYS